MPVEYFDTSEISELPKYFDDLEYFDVSEYSVSFSTGYLPFRPGLVSGDRCSEKWPKNASSRVARVLKNAFFGLKFWREFVTF